MRSIPKPMERYLHFKGNQYQVLTIAKDAKSGEPCVVYQALYGDFSIYVRSLWEFLSEVDKKKYPQATAHYRFTLIEEEARFDEEEKASLESSCLERAPIKSPEDEGEIDKDLLAFLEAETNREKIEILDDCKGRLTESILCAMEASMDLCYDNDDLEERFYSIRHYLKTKEQFEGTRLR